MSIKKQEAHGPHCSPKQKILPINKYWYLNQHLGLEQKNSKFEIASIDSFCSLVSQYFLTMNKTKSYVA